MAKFSDLYGSQQFAEASANGWLQGYVENDDGSLSQAKFPITDIAELGDESTEWIEDVGSKLSVDVNSGISAINWIYANEENIQKASATTSATYNISTATDKSVSGDLSAGLTLDLVSLHNSANSGKAAFDYINSAKYTFKYDNVDENNGTGSLKNGLTFDFKGSKFEQEILDQIKLKQAYKYTSESLPASPTDEQKTWIWVSGNGVLATDKCDEYIWDAVVNNWVKIGSTELDLTTIEDSANKGAIVYNHFYKASGDLFASAENGQDAYDWIDDIGDYLLGSAKSGANASAWINKSAKTLDTAVSNSTTAYNVLQSAKLTIQSGGANYTANLSSSPTINLEGLYGSAKSGANASAWINTNTTRINNIESSASKTSAWVEANSDKVTTSYEWVTANGINVVNNSNSGLAASAWIDEYGKSALNNCVSGQAASAWINDNGDTIKNNALSGLAASAWVATNKDVVLSANSGANASAWLKSNGDTIANNARSGLAASAWVELNKQKLDTLNDATITIVTGNELSDAIVSSISSSPIINMNGLYGSAKSGKQAYDWTNSATITLHTAHNHTATMYVKNGVDIDLSEITNANESGRLASAWISANEQTLTNNDKKGVSAYDIVNSAKYVFKYDGDVDKSGNLSAGIEVDFKGSKFETAIIEQIKLKQAYHYASALPTTPTEEEKTFVWIVGDGSTTTDKCEEYIWDGEGSKWVKIGSMDYNFTNLENSAKSGVAASAWVHDNGTTTKNNATSGFAASAWLKDNGTTTKNNATSGFAASAWISAKSADIISASGLAVEANEWVNAKKGDVASAITASQSSWDWIGKNSGVVASAKSGVEASAWVHDNGTTIKNNALSGLAASAWVATNKDVVLSAESGVNASAWIHDNAPTIKNNALSGLAASAWIATNEDVVLSAKSGVAASAWVHDNGTTTKNNAASGFAASAWIYSNSPSLINNATSGKSAWDWIEKNKDASLSANSGAAASAWIAGNITRINNIESSASKTSAWIVNDAPIIANMATSGHAASSWIATNKDVVLSAESGVAASAWIATNKDVVLSAKSGVAASAWINTNKDAINSGTAASAWINSNKGVVSSAEEGHKAFTAITAANGINDKIKALENFNAFIVVSALPDASENPSKNKIYLLPSQDAGQETDKCREYVFTDNGWMKIGDIEISLTNYVDKTTTDWTNVTGSASKGQQAYNWTNSATIKVRTGANYASAYLKNGYELDLSSLFTSAMNGQNAYNSIGDKLNTTALKNYTLNVKTGTASNNTANVTINATSNGNYSGIATSGYVTAYVASVSSTISTTNSSTIASQGAKDGSAAAVATFKSATLYYTTSTAGTVSNAKYYPSATSDLNTQSNPFPTYNVLTGYVSAKSASIASSASASVTGSYKSFTISSKNSRNASITSTAYTPDSPKSTVALATTAYVDSVDLWTSSSNTLSPRSENIQNIILNYNDGVGSKSQSKISNVGLHVSSTDPNGLTKGETKVLNYGVVSRTINGYESKALFVEETTANAIQAISGTQYEADNDDLFFNKKYNYASLRASLDGNKWLGYSFFDYSSNRGFALECGFSNNNKNSLHYGFYEYTDKVTDEFKNENSGNKWALKFNPYDRTCSIYDFPVLKQSAISWETYIANSGSLKSGIYYVVT